jgi:hypothetical protein
MTSIRAFTPRLTLVGSRTYVLGADLFREFELGAREQLGAAAIERVRSFKLHREIRCAGEWRLADAQSSVEMSSVEASAVDKGAAAEIEWLGAGGAAARATFVEGPDPIAARSPDPAPRLDGLAPDLDFGGTALAPAPRTSAELLYALVEGNKANHIATLKARGAPFDRIRFIYVEDLPWLSTPDARPWELAYKRLGSRPASDRTYTLVAVRSPRAPKPIKICYSHGH